jgi:lipoprotein-releasing system ATP-binding protein
MSFFLAAESVSKSFPRTGGRVTVLEDCDFHLARGETVAVMGPSGSGKSTLLNLLGGLDAPTRGRITFQGAPLAYRSAPRMTRWRTEGVGFVFQFHFLLPDFTALENLLIPVRAHRPVVGADEERAWAFLEAMGLQDRAEHLPGELSGGEQQRVAVARAFMNRPAIVLADEPFGNLDRERGDELGDLLFTMLRQEGASLVLVTHDPSLAARADRTLHLLAGRLVDQANPGEA